jgi:uncharacterized protein YjbI with pentapeptide repeats
MAMPDTTRGLDGENPVNPFSLLEAVNSSADTVNTGWLIFLGVMSYLLITIAGITHKDLLLSSDIQLPVLQVKIDLTRFFLFAPILLVLFHMGIIGQLVLLARKTLEFDSAIRLLEPFDKRTHPLRLELDNFFFVQGIAGPERSRIMSMFLHGMSWLTLVALPVLILLYIQVSFLPYHDVAITSAHRVALFADIAMLTFIGTFLARSETSFVAAFRKVLRQHPVTTALTAVLMTLIAGFSLFIATIPGERLDRITDSITGRSAATDASSGGALGFAVPFLKPKTDGSLFGLFYRNLHVTDTDLVVDKDVVGDEPSINLRGRDLRFARLDRSDLHQADFTGADLEGASFVGADLRKVTMHCADLNELLLTDNRQSARCTDARRANFTRARMGQAKIAGADLRGARFDDARLEFADLSYASMAGTSFASAFLDGAQMQGGVTLFGANFLLASMRGVDLSGARMTMADLSSASMQGAILTLARLEGAILRDADLEAADLQLTRLTGTDLSSAKVTAADFRGATVWRAMPPAQDPAGLADFGQATLRPLDDIEVQALRDTLQTIENVALRRRVTEGIAGLVSPTEPRTWVQTPDAQRWAQWAQASPSAADYRAQLTEHLRRLMCRQRWADGAVATGVARRAMGQGFRGDAVGIYDRVRQTDCPAQPNVPRSLIQQLSAAVDSLQGR